MVTHSHSTTLALPADIALSSHLRRTVTDFLKGEDVADPWVFRLTLVMDELFMNAVKYGSAPESSVYITLERDGDMLRLMVEDEGKGGTQISPQSIAQKVAWNRRHGNLTSTSGRGLALLAASWTDRCHITHSTHGGITVRLEKSLHAMDLPPTS